MTGKVRPADVPRIAREIMTQIAANQRRIREQGTPASVLADPYVAAFLETGTVLAGADLILVSPDMTTLAVDAARDIPDFSITGLAPARNGMIVFGRALPPITPTAADGPNATDSFRTATGFVLTWAWIRDDAVHILLWGHSDDIDWVHSDSADDDQWRWDTMFAATFEANRVYNLADVERTAPTGASVLAVIASTWAHMSSPGVARERVVVSAKKAKGRRGSDRVRPVKVVELCPPKSAPAAAESGRVYTHRWWVDPYWRSQPYGPGSTLRRPVRVPGHIKGPESAPMLPSRQRVYQWRNAPERADGQPPASSAS